MLQSFLFFPQTKSLFKHFADAVLTVLEAQIIGRTYKKTRITKNLVDSTTFNKSNRIHLVGWA